MAQLSSILKYICSSQLLKSLPVFCQCHFTPRCRYIEKSHASSPFSSVLGIIFKEKEMVQVPSRRIKWQRDFLCSSALEAELPHESPSAQRPHPPQPIPGHLYLLDCFLRMRHLSLTTPLALTPVFLQLAQLSKPHHQTPGQAEGTLPYPEQTKRCMPWFLTSYQ